MQSKLITTTDEFFKLKEDWERLQEQDDNITYYSTFEYNWTWWDVYKNDEDMCLFIICIYKNSEVVGIAPFIIERKSKKIFSYNILRFMGVGDYLTVLVNRKEKNELTIIKEIFKVMKDNNYKYQRIMLTHIRHDSLLAAYLLRREEYNNHFSYLVECPIINLGKYDDFDEYKKYYISSAKLNFKNKLYREVGYKFEIINNYYKNIFNEISDLHISEQQFLIKSKNRKKRRSLFKDERRNEFIKNLYKNNKNVITFVLKDRKDKLLSYSSCYFYKGTLYGWNQAYNPDFYNFRVSQVLYYELIMYIFENKIGDILDFGAGRYPWKFEWTNEFIFDYQLDMWNEETKKGKVLKKLYELKNRFSRGLNK